MCKCIHAICKKIKRRKKQFIYHQPGRPTNQTGFKEATSQP